MPSKTRPQKSKRKKSKAGPPRAYATSTILVATQNLINMVAVSAVSGTALLGVCTENLNPDVVVMKSAKDRV
jgi:hypothetical protein